MWVKDNISVYRNFSVLFSCVNDSESIQTFIDAANKTEFLTNITLQNNPLSLLGNDYLINNLLHTYSPSISYNVENKLTCLQTLSDKIKVLSEKKDIRSSEVKF